VAAPAALATEGGPAPAPAPASTTEGEGLLIYIKTRLEKGEAAPATGAALEAAPAAAAGAIFQEES
jgi:hypothetical protein